jgi:amino acid transporter
MTEELLEEARIAEARYRHTRLNRKLQISTGLLSIIICLVIILFPDPGEPESTGELIETSIGVLLVLALFSAFLSMIISLIPIKKWSFFQRFKRFFWISMVSCTSFILFCLTLLAILRIYDPTL